MSDAEAVVRWLGVLTIVSVAFAPVVWWLARGLDNAASALVRPLSLVFLTAMLWWPAAVLDVPFSGVMLIATVAVTGVAAWTLWFRSHRETPWRSAVIFEVTWLVLFGVYALFRSYQPNIANTEKPMEIAFLSSISRSTSVPAPDPWLAGETINYYYFGYQMVAALVKMSGVPPAIAFNLALAMLFASVGTVAAGIGYRIAMSLQSRRVVVVVSAALSSFFVLMAGNLEAFLRLVRDPAGTWQSGWWYDGVGWEASRIIVDHDVHGVPGPRTTINEFPAFSFVLGDLHPHVLTYPLLLCVVALAVSFFVRPEVGLPRMAVAGSLAGLLYVSNSWDAPLGLALIAGSIIATSGIRSRETLYGVLVVAGAAFLAALPFLLHFTAPVGVEQNEVPAVVRSIPLLGTVVSTLGVVTWRPSDARELLTVHGHWVVAALYFCIANFRSDAKLIDPVMRYRKLVGVVSLFAVVVAIAWSPALVLIGLPLAATTYIAISGTSVPDRVVAGLFAAGFALVLIPEYLYIQDAFNDRMNTVFKLYFQAWALLAIATAGTIVLAISSPRPANQRVAIPLVFVLVLVTLPYTPISARDWTGDFFVRYGLDGAGYISRSTPDDAAALAWLDENAPEGATIVEGPGCSYQTVTGVPVNRFSAFTGIPTIVGWEGHERQWRRGESDPIGPRLTARQDLANAILDGETPPATNLRAPTYIVLGNQEASGSTSCDPLRGRDLDAAEMRLNDAGWAVVFESGNTRILEQQ